MEFQHAASFIRPKKGLRSANARGSSKENSRPSKFVLVILTKMCRQLYEGSLISVDELCDFATGLDASL